jgi:outer membrane protein OmpA-like peptidoglycan-associated protein
MKKTIQLLFFFVLTISYSQKENYIIKNIDSNKEFQDFGVAYFKDSLVVFSSARKSVFMKRVWSGNHQPFLRLYQGKRTEDAEITDIKHFGNKIDTKYHESNLTFSNDFKTVYFDRNNYFHKEYRTNKKGINLIQIYKATITEDGNWVDIERLPFNSDEYSSGHPVLNSDNTKLYFISDRSESFGETDIYVVDINSDGSYGEPKNLGRTINTSKKEMFPYIDENNILYFSSNGLSDSKGDLDIYATTVNKQGNYFTPINLGFPINSNADDFAFVKQKGKNTGYFSSNRKGGKGDDDIYAVTELQSPKFSCLETIEGTVKNSKNNKALPNAAVTIYNNNTELETVLTDNAGLYSFTVNCQKNYKIIASKQHFTEQIKNLDASGNLKVNMVLTPEENDHFINVRNQLMLNIEPIYFDLAKATIKPESEKELQKVADIMKKYPQLIIQVKAHTDSRGRDDFNYILSDKRANAVLVWLLKKGINRQRILAIGFGEEQLLNDCKNGVKCTEEEHLENRRTEFVIVNPYVIGN